MHDLSQSIAHLLNTTNDELKSVVEVSKENLPQLYNTLVKEHVSYVIFSSVAFTMIFLAVTSFLLLLASFNTNKKFTNVALVVTISSIVVLVFCFYAKGIYAPNYSFLVDALRHK